MLLRRSIERMAKAVPVEECAMECDTCTQDWQSSSMSRGVVIRMRQSVRVAVVRVGSRTYASESARTGSRTVQYASECTRTNQNTSQDVRAGWLCLVTDLKNRMLVYSNCRSNNSFRNLRWW